MKKLIVALALTVALPAGMAAQDTRQSYQEFRRSLHRDYQAFRSRILEHYADFLDGEWHPYEPLRAPGRYESPKPDKAPVYTPPAVPASEVKMPRPVMPEPQPVRPVRPLQKPEAPVLPEAPAPQAGTDDFDFYGMEIAVPHVQFNILNRVASPQDAAAAWRALDDGDARRALTGLRAKADEMGLNGYLTYRLIDAWAGKRFAGASAGARTSLAHYMLANLGYDVRMALADGNTPLLLIPFEQTVYGSMFLTVGDRNYTVFAPDGTDLTRVRNIYTCELPKGEDAGRAMDLRLNGLKLPYKPYTYDITGGDLHLTGTVNANLFEMLYRYPQMPTEDYASSVLDEQTRRDLVAQVREQLGGKTRVDAVNALMSFFHQGLPYATDEARHGFEKPYFVEEILYYDKCDCEDRAIAFTWLLWNALGIPNQLIAYPMHESASVSLDADSGVGGYSYTVDGATYYSADPTYIGSKVGDVMPQFATVSPKVDKTYR